MTHPPTFYRSLDDKSLPQLALRLLMLTGLRNYPVRYAHLHEIDEDLWTISGEKMKGRKVKTSDFRPTLTPEALCRRKVAKVDRGVFVGLACSRSLTDNREVGQ